MLAFAKTKVLHDCNLCSSFGCMVHQSAHIPSSTAHFSTDILPQVPCSVLAAPLAALRCLQFQRIRRFDPDHSALWKKINELSLTKLLLFASLPLRLGATMLNHHC